MKTMLLKAACVGMGAVALAGGVRAARAVGHVAATPARVDRLWLGTHPGTPLAGVHVRRLAGPAAGDSLDLGTLRRAVVFAYDPSCAPSNGNMVNWTDLVRRAPPGAPVYVLTFRPADRLEPALRYWDGMQSRVHVVGSDTATLVHRLRVTGTPTTLLVRDGRVERRWIGFLGPRARAEVHAALRETQRAASR